MWNKNEHDMIDDNRRRVFAQTPIAALRPSTLENLSNNLDPERIATQRNGLLRNWKGLLELIGLDNCDLIMKLEYQSYQTKTVLQMWQKEPDATIETLIQHLEAMGRYDAIDDAMIFFDRDAEKYSNKIKSFENSNKMKLFQGDNQMNSVQSSEASNVWSEMNGDCLTFSDSIGNLAYYDAFICYTHADGAFVEDLITNLEKGVYQLKLCIPERDVLPGLIKLTADIDIIRTRCRRMIIVLSPAFLNSPELSFLTTLVQAISVDDRKRIIVPVIYKKCQLPPTIHALSKLDYTRGDMFGSFWGRLVNSLRLNSEPSVFSSNLSLSSSSDSPSPSSGSRTPPPFDSNTEVSYNDKNENSFATSSSGYSSFSVQINSTESNAVDNVHEETLNHDYSDESSLHNSSTDVHLMDESSETLNYLSLPLNLNDVDDNSKKSNSKIWKFFKSLKKLLSKNKLRK